jgi:hypothetical protein
MTPTAKRIKESGDFIGIAFDVLLKLGQSYRTYRADELSGSDEAVRDAAKLIEKACASHFGKGDV